MGRTTIITDKQILDLLKQGKSYADIQAELTVSPSRISTVKKKNAKEFQKAPEKEPELLVPKDTTEKTLEVIESAIKLNGRSRGVVYRNLALLLAGDENEMKRHIAEVQEFRRIRDSQKNK
jgi:hypothetical protein